MDTTHRQDRPGDQKEIVMSHIPKAHLVHGAFDRDGSRFIDWLAPYFEKVGYQPVADFDYGWTGIFSALFFNNRLARILKASIGPGDVVCAHSNGADIARRAAGFGAPIRTLILLNPALDRGTQFAAQIERVCVFHSPSEIPTWIARFLPFHPWGDMGRVGYGGYDARVININVESPHEHSVKGHTGVSTDKEWWGPQIAACAPRVDPVVRRLVE